ncbi:MAG: hypothetical protein IJ017_00780 [Oscillospiraceae bacterium]|nr:hypothetical protein [Oscillospiraceae bacterium]
MNGQELLDKMGFIDPEYIENAAAEPRKIRTWVKWYAVAACICIIIGGVIFWGAAGARDITNQTDGTADAETDFNEQDISDVQITGESQTNESEDQNDVEEEQEEGMYIPPMELPDTVDTATMDMIGVVVYKGGIYTQSYSYFDDEAERIRHLVGEHLGTATGTINEWSKQDDYAQEFASSLSGEVYTVNGYDSDFRICICIEYTREDGENFLMIQFLDRLNGITLANGEGLFEDRLHIRERTEKIQWQSHDEWNYGGEVHGISFDDTEWEAFLDVLYRGELVYTYVYDENDPTKGFYEDKPYSSIFDNPNQVHLILNMDDGTTVRLRLIEGGYVGLEHVGWWYFIKMPGEAFDTIYDACEGTHIDGWVVAR